MDAESLDILLEDGPLLAVNKPPGIITQGAPRGVEVERGQSSERCRPDAPRANRSRGAR